MKKLLNSLNETERGLIRETEVARMKPLDEDALVELHTRIRRTRNKYAKLYRRGASARVAEVGGRGAARPKNRRNAGKAEVFEDALARVSRRLAAVARQSAADLKAERIALARSDGSTSGPGRQSSKGNRVDDGRPATKGKKSPARKKREASTLAAGARRQAKRDKR